MHLGIVELYEKNHHSLIYNWAKVAKLNNWDITLYIRENLYEDISGEFTDLNFRIVVCEGGILKSLRHIVNDYKNHRADQLLFLSLTGNIFPFLFISLANINYGVTVHNSNSWFIKNTIRKPRHLLKRFIRYKLRKDADYFIVNSENMKRYIETYANEKRPISVMPFSLKRASTQLRKTKNNQGALTITYPGSVNVKRKRYGKFLQLAQDNPDDKFILLGSLGSDNPKNGRIFNRAKRIPNMVTFEEYLPVDLFNDYLRNSDILFSDINIDYKISDMSETYGVTKDSGISYLMGEFALPALLNDGFKNIPEMESGTIGFSTYDDLSKKFDLLHKDKYRASVQQKLKEDLNCFTVEKYAKELKKLESNQ